MISIRRLSLATAIPQMAPQRIPMNGATGFQFLEVPSLCYVRLDDSQDRIPISGTQELQLCKTGVQNLYVDNDNIAGAGELVLLVYTSGEMMSAKTPIQSSPLELIDRWQGIETGHTKLAALKDPSGHNTGIGGASVTQTVQYSTVLGALTARAVLAAPAGAWGYMTVMENLLLDVMAGLDPTNTTPTTLRLVMPEVWRVSIPVHVASLVNTGVVGSGDEARVHAGFVGSVPAYGNGTHWPGPGLFFVTKQDTQTWKAVIAAGNRNIANNRQEYWSYDTGVSYLAHHILTVQVGWQGSGAVIVQWAIDGVIVAERTTRLAALLDPADFSTFGGASAYRWCTPGVTCTAPLLNDTLDVYHAYGPGWQLHHGMRTVVPGQLGS